MAWLLESRDTLSGDWRASVVPHGRSTSVRVNSSVKRFMRLHKVRPPRGPAHRLLVQCGSWWTGPKHGTKVQLRRMTLPRNLQGPRRQGHALNEAVPRVAARGRLDPRRGAAL